MGVDRNGLEILSREECLGLVRSRPVGRVAISSHALPVILPVNYRVLDEAVVFATGVGSKSLAVADKTVVAFEVDDFDAAAHCGWSVLVVGVARLIDERDDYWEPAQQLDLHPWVGHHARKLVSIPMDHMTGRRLTGVAALQDGAPSSLTR